MGSGKGNDGSTGLTALNLGDEYLYSVADVVGLTGNLLCLKKGSVACAGVKDKVTGGGINLINDSGDDLLLLILVFLGLSLALCGTDCLDDHLASGLGGEAAEVLCLKLCFYNTAELVAAAECLRIGKRNLANGVNNRAVGYYGLLLIDLHITLYGVKMYSDNCGETDFLLAGICKCLFDFCQHVLLGDTVFFLKDVKGVEQFCVHFSVVP